MSDDLDDLIRRAMKTLDDQVPSGYFEGLPNRALARLGEDSSMQTSTGNTSGHSKAPGVPVQDSQDSKGERDEDSGLHDIRSMASSTKLRISSKRTTTQPPVDEDILASSSAGWKAVALPEPAKMVSLPDISELSPVSEVKSERKSKKELKAERLSAKQIAQEAVAVEASPVPAPKPDIEEVAPAAPVIGARFAQKAKQKQSSKTGLYALVGVGLAAAAGVGWYVSTQMGGATHGDQVVAQSETAAAQTKTIANASAPPPGAAAGSGAAMIAVDTAPTESSEPKAEPVATGMAMDEGDGEDRAGKAEDKARPHKNHKAQHGKKDEAPDSSDAGVEVKKPEAPKDKPKGGSGAKGEEGEPSFDALLKEAGVPEGQKQKKIVLEKKSLSSVDIKKGMGAVTGKAQACYAGTQGTAQVRLTVAPSGQIQKVSVTGVFAGTPVGACVEAAVKGATFPPWEGGPQSFGYSYLLAE